MGEPSVRKGVPAFPLNPPQDRTGPEGSQTPANSTSSNPPRHIMDMET